jgi:multidrug efflux pump subunit AcrB
MELPASPQSSVTACLFGRTWQVNVQGEALDRSRIDDVFQINVRNTKGEMVPLRAIASARVVLGPQSIIRYNNFRSVTVNGGPAPGRSSGEAIAAMERISAASLPKGYSFEWTGTALQEKEAAGKTTVVLRLAVLFAYLFLVALYESCTIPVPVLLSVSVGVAGAMGALLWFGLDNNLFAQIGLVVLIALAAKNGILMMKSQRYAHRSGQRRGLTPLITRLLTRRSAIEPVIGHVTEDGRLWRNFLHNRHGDRLNAILAGVGQNVRLLLKWFELLLRLVLGRLFGAFSPRQAASV